MTPDAISRDPELFENAVARLAQRPRFMAQLLWTALAGDVSAARIAAELNCPIANAIRVALMRAPRTDLQMFREDVTRIAEAAGVDRGRLLAIIRQAQSLAAFEEESAPADHQQGMLLAARDVVPDAEDQEG